MGCSLKRHFNVRSSPSRVSIKKSSAFVNDNNVNTDEREKGEKNRNSTLKIWLEWKMH